MRAVWIFLCYSNVNLAVFPLKYSYGTRFKQTTLNAADLNDREFSSLNPVQSCSCFRLLHCRVFLISPFRVLSILLPVKVAPLTYISLKTNPCSGIEWLSKWKHGLLCVFNGVAFLALTIFLLTFSVWTLSHRQTGIHSVHQ